jgi:hypothetical protein
MLTAALRVFSSQMPSKSFCFKALNMALKRGVALVPMKSKKQPLHWRVEFFK